MSASELFAVGTQQVEACRQSPGSGQGLLLPRLRVACARCSREAGSRRGSPSDGAANQCHAAAVVHAGEVNNVACYQAEAVTTGTAIWVMQCCHGCM